MSRVAVITGGASGLGLALAKSCAGLGMSVALLDRDGERAVAEAAFLPDGSVGLAMDVADAVSVAAAAEVVADRFGRADLVVSNVGVQLFGALEAITDEELRWVLDVNVVGSLRVATAFLPLLRKSDAGRIAFTTSASVLSPGARMGAYQSSKFALWGLAETLRLELAEEEIGVSVLFPSGMMSRHLETSAEAQPAQLRRPVMQAGDHQAMVASNPSMVQGVLPPEDAARGVIEALLAGETYVVTHGDLVNAVDERSSALRHAAESAVSRHA